jgi:hypothetical protein
MTCPPFTDLCASNALTVLHEHLSGCPRCKAIVARVEASEAPVARIATAAAPAAGLPPRPGDVCTFWAPTSDEYVVGAVLEANPTELLIVPLLMDTTWASQEDLVLSADILGYPALAPVWAADHVLAEQAVETVDVLSEGHLGRLATFYDAFFAGEPLPEPGGPPVLGDQDSRVAAHAAIADDLRQLYAPWAMLQIADELGPVLAQRRAELGVELEQLEGEPKTWTAFEAGEADPYTHIPAKAMAQTVRMLGLVASRRLLELARASVRAHHIGDQVTAAAGMARRRRGVAPRPRQDPEAARAAADRYADRLAEELEL